MTDDQEMRRYLASLDTAELNKVVHRLLDDTGYADTERIGMMRDRLRIAYGCVWDRLHRLLDSDPIIVSDHEVRILQDLQQAVSDVLLVVETPTAVKQAVARLVDAGLDPEVDSPADPELATDVRLVRWWLSRQRKTKSS